MKIKPLKTYQTPAYPTHEETRHDPGLLGHLPRRWKQNNTLGSLLGTGLMLHIIGNGCKPNNPNEDKTDGRLSLVDKNAKNKKMDNIPTLPVTRVAPILAEALANDGRGSFGCVAVSAPVFLSENEALDLIQGELEKAGLKLHDMVSLDGVRVPAPSRANSPESDDRETGEQRLRQLVDGAYTFDLGTEDKSVLVKFLQGGDYYHWDDTKAISTAYGINLAWLASEMAGVFKQRTKGAPAIIGLFFDPIVYPDKNDDDINRIGLSPEQKRFIQAKYNLQSAEDRGREKLQKQILHFIKYLKQEGVIE